MADYLTFHHLCTSLQGAAGQVLWNVGPRATTADIVCLLQMRFRIQLQVEHFKAKLRAWRRAPGELLQTLYQDITRLVTMAYPPANVALTNHVGKEACVTKFCDHYLQLEVTKQEPVNLEAALSQAIKIEAYEQSLSSTNAVATDQDEGRTKRRPHKAYAVADKQDSSDNAALCRCMDELQEVLEQATKGIMALAHGQHSV